MTSLVPRQLFAALFLLLIPLVATLGQTISATWLGGSGIWSDGSLWSTSPVFPNNGSNNYLVTIDSGSVALDQPITVNELTFGSPGVLPTLDLGSNTLVTRDFTLRSGTVTGAGALIVTGSWQWQNGFLIGDGATHALNGIAFVDASSSSFGRLDRALNCYGDSFVNTNAPYMEELDFGPNAALNIMPEASMNGSRLMILGSDMSGIISGAITNHGTLVVDDPGLNRGMLVFGSNFINEGTVKITNSSLDLRVPSDQPALLQNAGSIELDNGRLWLTPFGRLNGGTLRGNGEVGNLESNARIDPTGAGFDFANSRLTLLPQSVVAYTFRQPSKRTPITCPRITNVFAASLDGTLEITVDGNLQSRIKPSSVFTILVAQSITGQFVNATDGARLQTTDGRGSFLVRYTSTTVELTDFKLNKRH